VVASGCSSTAQKKLFEVLLRVNVRELVEDLEKIKARPVGPASSCGAAGCSASVGDVKIPLLKK
jgi:hypothetical protein